MDSTHSNLQKLVKLHCIFRGKQEINKGSPTEDHQWTQHTQTSENWKNRFAARQAVLELHVAPGKTGKFWKF